MTLSLEPKKPIEPSPLVHFHVDPITGKTTKHEGAVCDICKR